MAHIQNLHTGQEVTPWAEGGKGAKQGSSGSPFSFNLCAEFGGGVEMQPLIQALVTSWFEHCNVLQRELSWVFLGASSGPECHREDNNCKAGVPKAWSIAICWAAAHSELGCGSGGQAPARVHSCIRENGTRSTCETIPSRVSAGPERLGNAVAEDVQTLPVKVKEHSEKMGL